MKDKRGIKHYLTFYAFAVVIYIAYICYEAFLGEGVTTAGWWTILYLPILFIGFLYVFNSVLDKFFPPKDNSVQDEFADFLKAVTTKVNNEGDFGIEDFNKLKDSERFQKVLFQTFQIKQHGETDEFNFRKIEKRFKKGSLEYKAASIVLDEVKKMMVN